MVNLFRFKSLRVAKSQNYETRRRETQVRVFRILFRLLVYFV